MADASETTPLLDNEPVATEHPSERRVQHNTSSPQPASEQVIPYFTTTYLYTSFSIAFSAISFVFGITVAVLVQHQPQEFHWPWMIQEGCSYIAVVSFFAIIISSINLALLRRHGRALWVWVNLILDAVIAWNAFAATFHGLFETRRLLEWYCSTPIEIPHDPIKYDPSSCQSFGRAIQICAGVALFSGLALEISNLTLFVLRGIVFVRSILARTGSLGFPVGEYTVQFTVKLLKKDVDGPSSSAPPQNGESRGAATEV